MYQNLKTLRLFASHVAPRSSDTISEHYKRSRFKRDLEKLWMMDLVKGYNGYSLLYHHPNNRSWENPSPFCLYSRLHNEFGHWVAQTVALGTLSNEDKNGNKDGLEKIHFWFTLYCFVQVIRVLFFPPSTLWAENY